MEPKKDEIFSTTHKSSYPVMVHQRATVRDTFLKKKKFRDMTHKERSLKIGKITAIVLGIICLLIAFFASVSLLSTSFKIMSGYHTRSIFGFASNPIAGLCVGIIATVVFQSSSSTTSLTVALVASDVLSVKNAIPVIMGANVGTSVTNTLVSLGHASDKVQFRRAMQGATVHDFFNIFLVLIFLPLQLIPLYDDKGWLELISYYIVLPLPRGKQSDATKKLNFIKMITSPIVKLFLKPNKCLLKLFHVEGDTINAQNFFELCTSKCSQSLCPSDFVYNQTTTQFSDCPKCSFVQRSLLSGGILKSKHLSDSASAGIALAIAAVFMVLSLIALAKLMSFALKKQTSNWIKKALLKHAVVAMLVGCVITVLMQSSSITTSSMVPLVAMNVITLQQMFPVTLGANVGTTITAFLAALGEGEISGLQIAICHFLFNFLGILLFYPVPYIRSMPIVTAQALGYLVSVNRLYGVLYIAMSFVVVPGTLLGLSFLPGGAIVGASLLYGILLFCYIWRQIRVRCPSKIPGWCPAFMKPNNREKIEAKEDLEEVERVSGFVVSEKSVYVGSSKRLQNVDNNGVQVVDFDAGKNKIDNSKNSNNNDDNDNSNNNDNSKKSKKSKKNKSDTYNNTNDGMV